MMNGGGSGSHGGTECTEGVRFRQAAALGRGARWRVTGRAFLGGRSLVIED